MSERLAGSAHREAMHVPAAQVVLGLRIHPRILKVSKNVQKENTWEGKEGGRAQAGRRREKRGEGGEGTGKEE